MKTLKIIDRFKITGRGDVFTLSLKENDLIYKEIELGTKFIVDDSIWTLRGIETIDRGFDAVCDEVGFLMSKDK